MKILIVDDEQLDLFVTKKLLGLEFDAEGFTSVEETMHWARQNDFDVVLIEKSDRPAQGWPNITHHVCADPDCPGGC